MICTPDLLPKVSTFDIDIFDECLSDKHNPIHASINISHNNIPVIKPNAVDEADKANARLRCKWDESKKDAYKHSFDMGDIDDIVRKVSAFNLTEATQSKIDDIANHLKNILLEPAKIVGICKQGNGNSKKSKKAEIRNPWFDAECNDSRKRYLKFKRGMPKQPSNYVKAVLRQLARKHTILAYDCILL